MAIVTIVLLVALGVGLSLTVLRPHPVGTPVVSYSYNISPLNTKGMNISQGTTLQANLTFTSKNNQQLSIPIENLKLSTYNEEVETSIIQEKVFNYSFSLSHLTLKPSMSNSTILTISLAQDAPIGRYELALNIGKITDRISGLSYTGTIPIEMIVTPKQ